MTAHIIIDTGHVNGDFRRVPGCAVCTMSEPFPVCSGAGSHVSIASADQKTAHRRRRRKRQRSAS